MANIWEYIATYNPQGFYEDNRAKMLNNSLRSEQIAAANRENALENKIMGLKDALAGGDKSVLNALGVYSPETTKKYIENEEAMLELARPLAESILKAAPENREKVYQQMLQHLKNKNVDVSDMPLQYDETMIQAIANSDPQKIRDERVNAYQTQRDYRLNEFTKERDEANFGRDLQKMELAHRYSEESAENDFSRDIRKLQYAYDRADAKDQEKVDWLAEVYNGGNGYLSREDYLKSVGKVLGVDVAPQSEIEKQISDKQNQVTNEGLDYLLGNMTPEQETNYVNRQNALARAKSTSTPRTPAQEAKDLYGAGYSSDSILKYQQSGNISDLEARPIQGGSIAADVQKYNMYNQEKNRIESAQGSPLTEDQDLDLQSKLGIDGQGLKNAEFAVKHGFKMEEIGAQGQNALNLEGAKQENRVAMADINAQNAQKLENLKQQNKVGLAWINDEISKGKELRQLDNDKSLAEFKNSLPTAEKQKYIDLAKYYSDNGFPTTPEQLVAQDYANSLKTAELDRQYKQAQIEKVIAEIPYVGMTNTMKEADKLMQEDPNLPYQDAFVLANKNKGTTVNVGNGEPAFQKKMAENDATAVGNYEKEIINLDKQIALLGQSMAAVRDPSLYQGSLGDIVNDIWTFLSSVGVDIRGLDSAAILNTGSSMLMGNLRKDLMPGPLSDRDLQFLIRMTPSLTKTPKQNAAILNMYRKMYQRQRDVLSFMTSYGRKNNTLNGCYEAMRDAGLDTPIFTEEEKSFAATGRGLLKEGMIVGGYRYNGGNPYDENNWEKKQ